LRNHCRFRVSGDSWFSSHPPRSSLVYRACGRLGLSRCAYDKCVQVLPWRISQLESSDVRLVDVRLSRFGRLFIPRHYTLPTLVIRWRAGILLLSWARYSSIRWTRPTSVVTTRPLINTDRYARKFSRLLRLRKREINTVVRDLWHLG